MSAKMFRYMGSAVMLCVLLIATLTTIYFGGNIIPKSTAEIFIGVVLFLTFVEGLGLFLVGEFGLPIRLNPAPRCSCSCSCSCYCSCDC